MVAETDDNEMEEIKIPRNNSLVAIGLIMGPVTIFLGWYFFGLANGIAINSPFIVQTIGVFIGLSGVFALLLSIREIINPSYLIINKDGINSRLSFGFVPWGEIKSIDLYDRMEWVGTHLVNVKGIRIDVKNPDKIMARIRGFKRLGSTRSIRIRGTPVFVPDKNWSWGWKEVDKKLQTYWAQYRKNSTL